MCLPKNSGKLSDGGSIGLCSFEEISEVELRSRTGYRDSFSDNDMSEYSQKIFKGKYSEAQEFLDKNEVSSVRKELTLDQIINNLRKMYKNGDSVYDSLTDEFYIYKKLKVKSIENIQKFINPLKFVRIFESFILLDRTWLLNECSATALKITQLVRLTKHVTKIVHDTQQKEWTYFLEDRGKSESDSIMERIPEVKYLTEWLDSMGHTNTHTQSKIVRTYIEKLIILGKSHINEAHMQGALCCKNNKADRNYLKKLPDNVWGEINNQCYYTRLSCYNSNKTKGGLVAIVINDKCREKIGITPTLTDGYDGFGFCNSQRIKNWCEFLIRTLSAGTDLNHIEIPRSCVRLYHNNDMEFRINGVNQYKEVWIEDDKVYISIIIVPMFI